MKCSKARRLINDYIDNNLDAKKSSALKQHLEHCPGCQMFLEEFKEIIQNAQSLESLSPSSETWLKIKARLKWAAPALQAPRLQRQAWFSSLFSPPKLKYALVSSFILLALMTGMLIVGVRYWGGKGALWRVDRHRYTLSKLEEAERHYQLAIKALDEAVSSEEEYIDPQVAEVFQKNLEMIDSSITACRKAVLHEPGNIEVRNYLLAAYREKVDLLDEIISVESKSFTRKESRTIL